MRLKKSLFLNLSSVFLLFVWNKYRHMLADKCMCRLMVGKSMCRWWCKSSYMLACMYMNKLLVLNMLQLIVLRSTLNRAQQRYEQVTS